MLSKHVGQWSIAILVLFGATFPAIAGPKEDAFAVIEQFKKAFDSSDVQGVVELFAPNAIFLGTISPKLITDTSGIEEYFSGITKFTPRSVTIESSSALVLSDTAVLFAGFDTFSQTRDGKVIQNPARFTFVVTKGDQGWRISHFHSSARPKAQ